MEETFLGVPKESMLGPFLFNIYIRDLFFLVTDINIADFADDATPYVRGDKISPVVASLERSANLMFNWFTDNKMKGQEPRVALHK